MGEVYKSGGTCGVHAISRFGINVTHRHECPLSDGTVSPLFVLTYIATVDQLSSMVGCLLWYKP